VNTTLGPYKLSNVLIDGYDVVVNRPRNAAYRAPGVPAPTFAVESLVDELAERLEMDPMDLRLHNAAREGDRRPNGVVLAVNGNIEVMEAVKNSAHYRSELTGKNRGRGVAVGFWNANSGQHSINAQVNSDGKVTLNGAAIDIGGLRTTEAMTLAPGFTPRTRLKTSNGFIPSIRVRSSASLSRSRAQDCSQPSRASW